MYIPKETIDLVREKVHIEDIIKNYVPDLKKKGKNYIGLCPFHREKTPSFTVSSEKQIFYCFGCHAGGNVFSFISKIERIDFPESVLHVAQIAGINVEISSKQEDSGISAINRLNNYAMKYYHAYIDSTSGKAGRDYLLKRGVKNESIDNFKLGFAPDAWSRLFESLKKHKADLEQAESIGLISRSKKKQFQFYDRFRNRVIFPIFDKRGQVIAFGGRSIDDTNPKYINSSESQVFKKRNELYGIDSAYSHIKDLNRAIIVEGYLDVIGCHQEGIKNVVAPLGTALTESQLRALSYICSEVIILFDADSAGINAAFRSLEVVRDINIIIRIAVLPEGDPFDYILEKGIRGFMAIVDSALNPVDFRIKRILAKKNSLGKINTLVNLFEILKSLEFETEKNDYIRNLSNELDIDENTLRIDFNNYCSKNKIQHLSGKNDSKNDEMDFETRSYKDLVVLLIHYPVLIEKACIDYNESEITDKTLRIIFKHLTELYYSEGSFKIDMMYDRLEGEELDFFNRAVNTEFSTENHQNAYTEIYINLKIHRIDSKISIYASKMKQDSSNMNQYLSEIEILRREKEKLNHYIYNKI